MIPIPVGIRAVFPLAVLATLQSAQSHMGDRVIPIYELTEEMVAQIDLKDGLLDEWTEREPTVTLLDFGLITAMSDISQPDPADLDFRIWLGWTRSPSRIYVAAIMADDVYVNDYEGPEKSRFTMLINDSMKLLIDADHSGGPFTFINQPGADAERIFEASNAQWYDALSEAPGNGNLEIRAIDRRGWPVRPPFGDGGGGVRSENPVFWVTEFYVTPFAHFDYEDQQASTTYDLVPGKVVGFQLLVLDRDAAGDPPHAWYELPPVLDLDEEWMHTADGFVDGLLVGVGDGVDDSAVHANSWARIKASFAE